MVKVNVIKLINSPFCSINKMITKLDPLPHIPSHPIFFPTPTPAYLLF